ncbi:MAG: hypothetical protein EBS49_00945 [Verrucomicrobia bacterium]|nr:hypothetical protein [Verrucomicrobiota bacterium]NBU68194.1 hypothetical protein [Verrucomicrobiota bacterium]
MELLNVAEILIVMFCRLLPENGKSGPSAQELIPTDFTANSEVVAAAEAVSMEISVVELVEELLMVANIFQEEER